jgi:uncharacterized protein YigA (DUF484 family)
VTSGPAPDLSGDSAPPVTAEAVAAYLRAHPAFLAENPALYRSLSPPIRVHGDIFADHMTAMLRAEREHAAAMAARADGVLAAGRAAAGLAARVQEAVLALLRATDPIDCATGELPALLAVDAVTLCIEALRPDMRPLPEGAVASLMAGQNVVFRSSPTDAAEARLLHGEAAPLARHAALVRIPGEGAPALIALVARDADLLDPAQGAGALAFLGRAMAAALGR